jgi:hypothetical protein
MLMRVCTLLRHILKLEGFISLRIKAITSDSEYPYCSLIASKDVRSSHAISMILLMSSGGKFIVDYDVYVKTKETH